MVIHNSLNPDPWYALSIDQSTFFDQAAKDALCRNNNSWSRKVILPIMRPIARFMIALIKFIRIFIPNRFTSPKALHYIICWGMKNFVSPDANYLIFRHFHIGTQILKFFNTNLAAGTLPSHPLCPREISDFAPNTFVQHDLNIYNFIINLNQYLLERNLTIQAKPCEQIDFSDLQDFDHLISPLPDKWHNFLDLQSAIELYTPIFALFLSDSDFWRASNSLQLDETVAIYAAKLLDEKMILALVNNKHPMVPLSTLGAGFRLMLHGLDAENLYGFIKFVQGQSSLNKEGDN